MPQRYNPPPGWPVPSGGWRPSFDWKPDPSWPPAPSGWVFWVKQEPEPEHVAAWKLSRKYVGAVVAVGLVGVGALALGLGADELHGGSHTAVTATPDWWGAGPVLGPLPAPARKGTVEIKASLVGMPINAKTSTSGGGASAPTRGATGNQSGASASSAGASSSAATGTGSASTGNRASRRDSSRGEAHWPRADRFGRNPSGFELAQGREPVAPTQRSRHRATSSEAFSWFGASSAGHQQGGHHSGPRHRSEGQATQHSASHHARRH